MEGKVVDWKKENIYMCECVRARVCVCAHVCVRACVFDMFVQLTIVIYLGGKKKKSSLNNHKPIIAHLTVSDWQLIDKESAWYK